MTAVRAGIGDVGCNPITNEQRIARWEARMTAWVAEQPDPDAEDLARGRRAAEGQKFQKALRKRPRVKLRAPKRRKQNNVVPFNGAAKRYTKGHRAQA